MATINQINSFINTIGPIIQKYASIKGYKYPSAIIAQACLESAYGLSTLSKKYYNYFGMKCGSRWRGRSVNMTTNEEYTAGTITTITDNFRVYSNMTEGVLGYFDFISISRYSNLKNATSYLDYIKKIKEDGYATSSSYITSLNNIVTKYNLTKFDIPKCNYPVALPTIQNGSIGQQVKYLQYDLTFLGFIGKDNKKLTVDGECGPNTVYAIKEFQKKYDLEVDGIYGPLSYNMMKSILK